MGLRVLVIGFLLLLVGLPANVIAEGCTSSPDPDVAELQLMDKDELILKLCHYTEGSALAMKHWEDAVGAKALGLAEQERERMYACDAAADRVRLVLRDKHKVDVLAVPGGSLLLDGKATSCSAWKQEKGLSSP